MQVRIEASWRRVLQTEFDKPYFEILTSFVRQEYMSSGLRIFPPAGLIFNAFNLCPFDKVKVVILGQDPYPTYGQAHGLSFSVPEGVVIPRSLQTIYQEIQNDLGHPAVVSKTDAVGRPTSGCLTHWAEQGVMLLNTTLTVQEGKPLSHQNKGWEVFTDAVIQTLSAKKERLIFLLWGGKAQAKMRLIDQRKHLVLKAPHPSPLAAAHGYSFAGCKHFSQTNEDLVKHGFTPIEW